MQQQANYLQQLLVSLRTRLLVMCASVGIALEDAGKAMAAGDPGRAASVIENDAAIDALENEIDEMALQLLARTQPVAGDLRFVVSALRMVVDLERIGDEAVSMLCNRPLTETSVAQSAASRMPTTIRSWVPVIDSPVSTVVWRHPSLRGCSSAIGVFFRAQQSKFVEVNLQACRFPGSNR